MPKSTPPPKSEIAPPSILGSRTTRTAFILVAISLAVVLGAFWFVLLRRPPEIPNARPDAARYNCPIPAGRGTVDANATYLYAPSFMRTADGTFHYWACWGNPGDVIGYKSASTLAGLAAVPLKAVLGPSTQFPFDQKNTCDPSVVRSRSDGRYYLHYGGETEVDEGGVKKFIKGIGVAVSDTPGGPYTKIRQYVFMSESVTPDVYGIGQPSVTIGPDGYYVIYTYQVGPVSEHGLVVLKSSSPDFPPDDVHTVVPLLGAPAWSVNLSYDETRDQFLITGPSSADIFVYAYDRHFNYLGTTYYNGGVPTGEGVALLGDEAQHPVEVDGRRIFAHATFSNRPPQQVTGPNLYQGFRPPTVQDFNTCNAPRCPDGQTQCGHECVNLKDDEKNCGECGKSCPEGVPCVNRRCEASCPSGETSCGGKCVNTQDDPKNCGGCGRKCKSGEECLRGKCRAT